MIDLCHFRYDGIKHLRCALGDRGGRARQGAEHFEMIGGFVEGVAGSGIRHRPLKVHDDRSSRAGGTGHGENLALHTACWDRDTRRATVYTAIDKNKR